VRWPRSLAGRPPSRGTSCLGCVTSSRNNHITFTIPASQPTQLISFFLPRYLPHFPLPRPVVVTTPDSPRRHRKHTYFRRPSYLNTMPRSPPRDSRCSVHPPPNCKKTVSFGPALMSAPSTPGSDCFLCRTLFEGAGQTIGSDCHWDSNSLPPGPYIDYGSHFWLLLPPVNLKTHLLWVTQRGRAGFGTSPRSPTKLSASTQAAVSLQPNLGQAELPHVGQCPLYLAQDKPAPTIPAWNVA